MKWRMASVALCTALAAASLAWAITGNPMSGVGVSVESSPGGLAVANGATNTEGSWGWRPTVAGAYRISVSGPTAVAACNRAARETPPEPPQRKGRGICIGKGGGAYFPTAPVECPGVVATVSNASRQLASEWVSCDALTGRDARAGLTPITLNAREINQPITISVGYVAMGAPAATTATTAPAPR